MRRRFISFCGVVFCLLVVSCGGGPQKEMADHLEALYGRKIHFVHDNHYRVDGRDTLIYSEPSISIVLFVDSLGCQPCKLRLGELGVKIRELKQIGSTAHFIVIVQNSDYSVFEQDAVHNLPGYPFVYDEEGRFLKYNELPLDSRYHAFLLNQNGEVVLVGNPIGNDKLWELYKQQIHRLSQGG